MKKLLKIFTVLIAVFIHNSYASSEQNNEYTMKKIDFFGKEIDKCKDIFLDKQKNNVYTGETSYSEHYKIFMANNEDVRDCYKNTAQLIFKEFYKDDYDELMKMYNTFVSDTYHRYLLTYGNNKFCKTSCGLMPEMKATQSTTYSTQEYLINLLDSLERFSTY